MTINIEISRELKMTLLVFYSKLDSALWEMVGKEYEKAEGSIEDLKDDLASLIVDTKCDIKN